MNIFYAIFLLGVPIPVYANTIDVSQNGVSQTNDINNPNISEDDLKTPTVEQPEFPDGKVTTNIEYYIIFHKMKHYIFDKQNGYHVPYTVSFLNVNFFRARRGQPQ